METIQQARKIHQRLRPSKRCGRGSATEAGLPSGSTAPLDFLNNRFEPILCDPAILENWQQRERHFIASLRYMEKRYKLKKRLIADLPYPLNVFETFREIRENYDSEYAFKKLFLVQNGNYPYCLATAEPMDTGHNLYYIPFDQIIKARRNRKHRKRFRLILCACAYLYQLAGIPSYTKDDYISGCYDMLREWNEENQGEWDAETYKEAISQLNAAEHYKTKMHRILSHPRHLSDWKHLLSSYKVTAEANDPALTVSAKFYELYRQYPERKIYDQRIGAYWPLDDDNLMELDQYMSFVWSNDGWLGAETCNYINDNAGNYLWIDEPLQFTIYDTPSGRPGNDLDFEKRLLDNIDQLATLLNDTSYDTNQPT